MRLLTFSVLRNYKIKTSLQFLFKNLSVDASRAKVDAEKTLGNESYDYYITILIQAGI